MSPWKGLPKRLDLSEWLHQEVSWSTDSSCETPSYYHNGSGSEKCMRGLYNNDVTNDHARCCHLIPCGKEKSKDRSGMYK